MALITTIWCYAKLVVVNCYVMLIGGNKMKSKLKSLYPLFALFLVIFLSVSSVSGQSGTALLIQQSGNTRIEWEPPVAYETAVLTVSGPNEYTFNASFPSGVTPFFEAKTDSGTPLASGSYTYQLQLNPQLSDQVKAQLAETADEDSRRALIADLRQSGIMPDPSELIIFGYLFIQDGAFLTEVTEEEAYSFEMSTNSETIISPNDQVIVDDQIVSGSLCVGQDCVNGESFGFDTIRLKENNLRIRAVDTSNSASFPSNDWQITFNDSSNGGANKFSIEDIDGARVPFTIEAGAPNHSLYIDDGGRLGLGTSTPVVDAHILSGNTPTVRLQQDGSSGFTAQTWDIAGNEAGFFVRDATNGSALSFRILPSAPAHSLVIEGSTGHIGLGTTSPDSNIHIVGDDANIHLAGTQSGINMSGSDGTTNILVQETSEVTANRTVLTLENNGSSNILFTDTSLSSTWQSGVFANNYIINQFGTGGNEFLIRPDGTILMGAGGNNAFDLDPNGNLTISGTLSDASSRALKENFVETDYAILDDVMALPIYFYNYKADDDSLQHIGPTAEDFAQIFEVGADDKHISPRDLAGVAVAAVQELTKVVEQKDQKINALETELFVQLELIEELEAKNAELEERLAVLEAIVLSQVDEPSAED